MVRVTLEGGKMVKGEMTEMKIGGFKWEGRVTQAGKGVVEVMVGGEAAGWVL